MHLSIQLFNRPALLTRRVNWTIKNIGYSANFAWKNQDGNLIVLLNAALLVKHSGTSFMMLCINFRMIFFNPSAHHLTGHRVYLCIMRETNHNGIGSWQVREIIPSCLNNHLPLIHHRILWGSGTCNQWDSFTLHRAIYTTSFCKTLSFPRNHYRNHYLPLTPPYLVRSFQHLLFMSVVMVSAVLVHSISMLCFDIGL